MLCLNISGAIIRACTRACFGPHKSDKEKKAPLSVLRNLRSLAMTP